MVRHIFQCTSISYILLLNKFLKMVTVAVRTLMSGAIMNKHLPGL